MLKKRMKFGAMSEKTDHYQKTVRVHYVYLALALGFLLLSACLWFFFGSFNTTFTGYGQCFGENRNLILVPMTKIDQVHPGMQIWVGNSRGEVEDAIELYYLDYEDICGLGGPSVAEAMTNGDHDQVFGEFSVSLPDLPRGVFTYSIVVDTKTPYEHYFGGEQNP